MQKYLLMVSILAYAQYAHGYYQSDIEDAIYKNDLVYVQRLCQHNTGLTEQDMVTYRKIAHNVSAQIIQQSSSLTKAAWARLAVSTSSLLVGSVLLGQSVKLFGRGRGADIASGALMFFSGAIFGGCGAYYVRKILTRSDERLAIERALAVEGYLHHYHVGDNT